MLSRTTLRLARAARVARPAAARTYAQTPSPVSKTNEVPTHDPSMGKDISESLVEGEQARVMQTPSRQDTWSKNQQKRELAMSGPRFEQTIFELQPSPEAAIELIHKQPVRWTHDRMVSCDGGGGPLGHPRIYINVDKPQICTCGYCGLPFANEHHREFLESLPETPYPLKAEGNPSEINESQRVTHGEVSGFEQR